MSCSQVRSDEILRLGCEVIKPFCESRAQQALKQFDRRLKGAFFMWLWLPNLPITSQQLYERLKARGVIVVPGHHFFPGLADPWSHANECLRINYAPDDATVAAGLQAIAEEVRRA